MRSTECHSSLIFVDPIVNVSRALSILQYDTVAAVVKRSDRGRIIDKKDGFFIFQLLRQNASILS